MATNQRTIITNQSEFDSNNRSTASNKLNYKHCEFHLEINVLTTKDSVNFRDCVFIKAVNITTEIKDLNFIECRFRGVAHFENAKFESANFIDCRFYGNTNFSDTNFKGKTRFYLSKFKDVVKFNNAKFDDLADFWNTRFNKPMIFYKTDFFGTAVFSSAKFHQNVLFTYTLIDKLIIFRGTVFKQGMDLSLSILNGSISLFDIKLKDFVSVEDLPRNQDHIYERNVTELATIPDKNKRETYRILKNNATNSENGIYALKFSSLELKAYQDSLKRKIYKRKNFFRRVEDYLILYLNSVSNNHGKSWIKGVGFTFSIGLIFFYFSLIATKNYDFGCPYNLTEKDYDSIFSYYFISLSPTHEFDFMKNEQPEKWHFLWDFVNRAFVAYGIYQTVQAFRKFRKS